MENKLDSDDRPLLGRKPTIKGRLDGGAMLNKKYVYLNWIFVGISVIILGHGCGLPTIDERLIQLTEDFPNQHLELKELSNLMLLLNKEIDFSGFVLGDAGENRPDKIVNQSYELMPFEKVREKHRPFHTELTLLQKLSSQLNLAYAHMETLPTDSSYLSVRITLHGGGVLGNDSGYIHLLEGKLSDYKQEGFWWKSIPDALNWNAFVD